MSLCREKNSPARGARINGWRKIFPRAKKIFPDARWDGLFAGDARAAPAIPHITMSRAGAMISLHHIRA
jgi:hypothetical protein